MKLRVERLRNGNWICRPASAVGTCGFYPFAWTMSNSHNRERAVQMFIMNHTKHLDGHDIEVVYD